MKNKPKNMASLEMLVLLFGGNFSRKKSVKIPEFIYPDGWGRRKRMPLNWSESQIATTVVMSPPFFSETSSHLELHGS